VLTEYDMSERLAVNPPGPVERVVEPSAVARTAPVRPQKGATLAESRARGAKAAGFVKGVKKRTPEQRERMRQAQLARYAAKRSQDTPPLAAALSNGAPNIPPTIPGTDARAVAIPCGGCAHAPVCAIKPIAEAVEPPASNHPALHLTVAVSCDHFLAV